jgi:hypothetical protein
MRLIMNSTCSGCRRRYVSLKTISTKDIPGRGPVGTAIREGKMLFVMTLKMIF